MRAHDCRLPPYSRLPTPGRASRPRVRANLPARLGVSPV
ncbi:MAG: hypothetical protein JSR82_11385 [Verrucomicrobia bacterium]|nr:hypothetical protein [Verrucomicrobiota bacterium]